MRQQLRVSFVNMYLGIICYGSEVATLCMPV